MLDGNSIKRALLILCKAGFQFPRGFQPQAFKLPKDLCFLISYFPICNHFPSYLVSIFSISFVSLFLKASRIFSVLSLVYPIYFQYYFQLLLAYCQIGQSTAFILTALHYCILPDWTILLLSLHYGNFYSIIYILHTASITGSIAFF
jgi:hypothetical protein